MLFHLPVLHFSCCCKRSWLIGRNLIFHGIILGTSVGYGTTGYGTTGFRKYIQYQKKGHIEKGMLYDGVFRKVVWVEQSSRLEFLSRLHIRISFSIRPIGWERTY